MRYQQQWSKFTLPEPYAILYCNVYLNFSILLTYRNTYKYMKLN